MIAAALLLTTNGTIRVTGNKMSNYSILCNEILSLWMPVSVCSILYLNSVYFSSEIIGATVKLCSSYRYIFILKVINISFVLLNFWLNHRSELRRLATWTLVDLEGCILLLNCCSSFCGFITLLCFFYFFFDFISASPAIYFILSIIKYAWSSYGTYLLNFFKD